MTTTTTETYRYVARGFVDDVTTCEHCGREELKGTVRLEIIGPDGDSDGEVYAGVVCAGRLSGRKAAEIRREASRADRARIEEQRSVYWAWRDAHSAWYCARRDAALGPNPGFAAICTWTDSTEQRAAEAAWQAANPEPTRPWG